MKNIRNVVAVAVAHAIGATSTSAVAQTPQAAVTKIERIEVTGSSIKRIDGESALPVSVVTREQIEKSGATSVEELLNRLPGVASNTAVNVAAASGSTTGGQSTASLRGLGGDRTLVLVNGRRIANFAGPGGNSSVDVNAIPISAIERIEVLKDGASAVYGSDAIAGVINFILRKDMAGAELTIGGGDTKDGGGGSYRVTGLFGVGEMSKDSYNVMAIFTHDNQRPLFGHQRPYAATSISYLPGVETTSGNTFPANVGIDVGGGINPLTGRYAVSNPGDILNVISRNPLAPANCAPSLLSPNFPNNRCRYDPAGFVSLIPKSERDAASVLARYALNSDVELYAGFNASRNKVRVQIQAVPLSDQFSLPSNNPLANQFPYTVNGLGIPGPFATILLAPSSPFYPSAYIQSVLGQGNRPVVFVRYRSLESGSRVFRDVNDQISFDVGAKAALGSWDGEVNFQTAQSKVREITEDGYPLYSKLLPILNSGQVNFFGPNTPAVSNSIKAANYNSYIFNNTSTLNTFSVKARRDIGDWGAGPIAVALGADLRRESYKLKPSEVWQNGDISGYGGQALPVDKSRKSSGVFAEIGIPITKTLELTGAARFDDYQSVGNTTNPKVSLRWNPMKEVLVRASHGRGFRAPSLYDLFAPQILGVTTVSSDPVRCPVTNSAADCSTQFTAFTGGNPKLAPERSKNSGVGFVLEPHRSISASLDWFSVDLRDQIIVVDPITILNNAKAFPGAVVRQGGRADGQITSITSTSRNQGQIKMSGIDIDFSTRTDRTTYGKFSAQLTGTYFTKYDSEESLGELKSQLDLGGGPTGGLVPRWKHTISLDWQLADISTNLAQNFQKGYREEYGNIFGDALTRKVGAYETYDLQAMYKGIKNLSLTFGVKNIFNRAPPYVVGNGSFQSGYDILYGDPRGRLHYLSATYKFM